MCPIIDFLCCSSSALASISFALSSYESGWKMLLASIAACPRCLHPKIRSIHQCKCSETCSLSRAHACFSTNFLGEHAHVGSATSFTAVPSCLQPRGKPLLFTRKEPGPLKNDGTSSFISEVVRSADSNAPLTDEKSLSGLSNFPCCIFSAWCGKSRRRKCKQYAGEL